MYVSADFDHPDPVSSGKICRGCGTCCDRKAVDSPRGNFWNPKDRYLTAISGILVPSRGYLSWGIWLCYLCQQGGCCETSTHKY
jgi:hypothetical protein